MGANNKQTEATNFDGLNTMDKKDIEKQQNNNLNRIKKFEENKTYKDKVMDSLPPPYPTSTPKVAKDGNKPITGDYNDTFRSEQPLK